MSETESHDEAVGLERLLGYLREARLFDFTGYKRGTLSRRVDKRMQQVGISTHEDYIDFLEVHPESSRSSSTPS